LVQEIPPEAQFDGEVDDADYRQAFPRMHSYFDLSNEQAFLRMSGRVSAATWTNWSIGMRTTMSRPAFAKAWQRVVASTTSFAELRRLVASDFTEDPYLWTPRRVRVRRWLVG
jgi:hypothetical protein